KGQHHQANHQKKSDAVAGHLDFFRDRAAFYRFDDVIEQMAAIQHGYRQEIENAETDTEEGQKAQVRGHTILGGSARHFSNGDGAAQVLGGNKSGDHFLDGI